MLSLREFTIGALALGAFGLAAPTLRRRRLVAAGPYAREAGVIVGLYVLWQLLLDRLVTQVVGAVARGQWIWDLERTVHLPSEASFQRLVLPHPLLVQASNGYYSGLHFPAMIGCLIWIFARHRDRYPWMRRNLILVTAIAAFVQAVPVAPPRLISGLGMVDTGVLYHQSDYGPNGLHDPGQLISMPSVHVAWAVLVALAVVLASRSAWRWLVVLHPILTMLVVVDTANHFWLDGIVAAAILGAVLAGEKLVAVVSARPAPVLAIAPAEGWRELADADAGT
jgi:PAP2 superfamily protein